MAQVRIIAVGKMLLLDPGTHPVGTGSDFPSGKAGHSTPSRAEGKEMELCIHSPICLHGIELNLIIYTDNFTLMYS
jgi:hypothetical protein